MLRPKHNNCGAYVGQSQQLVHDPQVSSGTTRAKSLSALTRQSN
jgi:hypothetical protein